MKIQVTNHCIEQIIKRKGKKNEKSAIFFALASFEKMLKRFKKDKNILRKMGKGENNFVLFDKITKYKFVYNYSYELDIFTLITFSIKTKSDEEIGKIIKTLGKNKKK